MTSILPRPNLLELLDRSKNHSLTLLVSPSGYGKTTLLSEWVNTRNHLLIIRYSVPDENFSMNRALNEILIEVRKKINLIDAPIFNVFTDDVQIDESRLVDTLIQIFESINQEVYFIVDDFQYLYIPIGKKVINLMLSNLPSNVHFIFSSRSIPSINITQLKLDENLLLIDSHDLMLSTKEIGYLAGINCHYDLSGYDLRLIEERTEGWLSGVKIILLALNENGMEFIKNLEKDSLDIMDCFFLDIYDSMTEEGRHFFLFSAIFKRFNDSLCDRVLNRQDSEKFIRYLMNRSAFIVKDDKRSGWYRYHALLKDFLSKQLSRMSDHPKLISLHKISSTACLDIDEYELSAYHALHTKDKKFIDLIFSKCCDYWLKQGEFSLVIKYLDEISENHLLKNEEFYLNYAYALIFSRRFNQAHYFLSLMGNASSNKRSNMFIQDVEFLKLSLSLFQRDIDGLNRDTVDRLLDSVNASDNRIFSLVIAAYFEMQNGHLDEALRLAHHARTILNVKGHVFLQCYADLIIALCDRYTGRGVHAIQYISNIYASIKMNRGTMSWLCMNVAMMVVQYEQNQLKSSISLCESILPYVNHACLTEVIATVYLYYSRLQFDLGHHRLSRGTLEQLNRILVLGRYPRFSSQSACELIRQAYVSGDHVIMERKLSENNIDLLEREMGSVVSGMSFDETQERRILSACYGHALNAQFEQAQLKLVHLIDDLESLGLVSRLIIAKCNYIVMEYRKGQTISAISQLDILMKEYSLSVFSRNLFDESPGIAQVFVELVNAYCIELPVSFMDVYRDIFDHIEPVVSLDLASLTDKESKIYQLLKSGLSNQQISNEIGVALSTTKWHLKNIYQKLGVNNRTEAIIKKSSTSSGIEI